MNDIWQSKSGVQLDIGCGASKQAGWVGMDIQKLPGVDVVHDFNIHPWPIPTGIAHRILASHILEHVPPVSVGEKGTVFPFIDFMNDAWRVLSYDSVLIAALPYWLSPGFAQDPTHVNPCNEHTWKYFDPVSQDIDDFLYRFYRPLPWKVEQLTWSTVGNIELVMSKRRIDKSYNANVPAWFPKGWAQ